MNLAILRDIPRTYPMIAIRTSQPELFHFEWYVDQHGYEAVSAEQVPPGVQRRVLEATSVPAGGGWYLRRKGGPLRAYRPLEEHPGLARRVAKLSKDAAAILEFANEFGFLGVDQSEHPEVAHYEEHVWTWHTHMKGLRYIVEGVEAGQKYSMASIFNQYVEPQMTVRITTDPVKRPTLQVEPLNLVAAMWLQVAGELTYGTKFRKCEWCPTWFPYGPGTKHKETKRFCSDRCRKAWHRHPERRR